MKLRNIFTALLAALTLTVSCEDEKVAYLDEIKVSQSYVAIDAAGGSTEITLNAKDEWSFSGVPEWLKVEPASGAAGKDITVTFSATAAKATKEAMLYLNCGSKSQIINVIQMTEKVDLPISTYKQIAAGQDGTVYRAKGTCNDIYNTEYGNWHLIDATGDLTIYGTLDKNGATKNFKSLGIEAGDIVTVEGPKKTYNGTVQLTDVTVIAIEKSLIKIESLTPAEALPKEGGVLEVALTCKGTNMEVVLPDAAKSWVSVAGISSNGKEASVKFSVAANPEGKRQADIVIKTVSGGKDYTAQFTLTQDGAIINATVAEVLKAEDGLTQYRVSGYISKDKNSEYGNIYIKDATGEIYVYGVLDAKGQSKQWNNMGIHEGDIITVVGPKTSFNKEPQMKNVSVESFKTVKDLTIKDFVAKADDKETYYRISGKVSGIKDGDVYGNFDLTDATGTVYVYGLVAGYGGEKKKFQELGIKDGDEITIVGVSTSFNGKKQVGNAFLVTKGTTGTDTPTPPTTGEDYKSNISWKLGNKAYDNTSVDNSKQSAKVNGVEVTQILKLGASSGAGTATLIIPKGTSKLSFYGFAWKGTEATLVAKVGGTEVAKEPLKGNDGVVKTAPYTITVTASDLHTVNFPTKLPVDTEVEITTEEAKGRVVLFGFKAE